MNTNSEVLMYAVFFALWKDFPNVYLTTEDVLLASQGIFPSDLTEEEKKMAIKKAEEYLCWKRKKK